jgi:hypothetical protein
MGRSFVRRPRNIVLHQSRCRLLGEFKEGSSSFFEKKNQKTFALLECVLIARAAHANRIKVFCFFFSKKKYFLPVVACVQK